MQIWTLTGGRRGNEVICEGVAEGLRARIGSNTSKVRALQVSLPRPFSWFPRTQFSIWAAARDVRIAPPYPDIVLASGAAVIAHARALRRFCFVAYLQNPHISARHFDFIWAPAHDKISGTNVYKTLFSPHHMTPTYLQAEATRWRERFSISNSSKIIGIALGGPNRVYKFEEADILQIVTQIETLARAGHYLLITPSRRTPIALVALLRNALTPFPHFLWDGEGDNPYAAMLESADHLLVSADSVNMIGEACSIGCPVQILGLSGGGAKFSRFHDAIFATGYARPFNGTLETWERTPINMTNDITEKIYSAYLRKNRL